MLLWRCLVEWGTAWSERLEASIMSSQSHRKIVYVLEKRVNFTSWTCKRMCAGLRQPCTRCSSSEKCLKERSGRALADKHCGSAVLQSSSTFMVSSFSSFRVPWSCGKDGKTEMVAYDKCHNSDMCSVKRI